MNEKAIESMNKDEPETALEYLKKVDETLQKLQINDVDNSNNYQQLKEKQRNDYNQSINSSSINLHPNYRATLYYNLACCYQRLGMLEECVDNLEIATKALKQHI